MESYLKHRGQEELTFFSKAQSFLSSSEEVCVPLPYLPLLPITSPLLLLAASNLWLQENQVSLRSTVQGHGESI